MDDKRNGLGTLRTKSGCEYTGVWRNDEVLGDGTKTQCVQPRINFGKAVCRIETRKDDRLPSLSGESAAEAEGTIGKPIGVAGLTDPIVIPNMEPNQL